MPVSVSNWSAGSTFVLNLTCVQDSDNYYLFSEPVEAFLTVFFSLDNT